MSVCVIDSLASPDEDIDCFNKCLNETPNNMPDSSVDEKGAA